MNRYNGSQSSLAQANSNILAKYGVSFEIVHSKDMFYLNRLSNIDMEARTQYSVIYTFIYSPPSPGSVWIIREDANGVSLLKGASDTMWLNSIQLMALNGQYDSALSMADSIMIAAETQNDTFNYSYDLPDSSGLTNKIMVIAQRNV